MSSLYYLSQKRRKGGPALYGAYTAGTKAKMDMMTKLDRKQTRLINHMAADPTLAADNPEVLAALQVSQEAETWGMPADKEEANFNLWKTIGKGAMSGLQFVGRELTRPSQMMATVLRGSMDSMLFDVEAQMSGIEPRRMDELREILKQYATNPEAAAKKVERLRGRERSMFDAIPDEVKPAAGMNLWERITAGFGHKEGSISLGQAVYRSADEEYRPEQSSVAGLKDLNFKIDAPGSQNEVIDQLYELGADLALDPLVWLTGGVGPTASVKVPIYVRGVRTEKALTPKGHKIYQQSYNDAQRVNEAMMNYTLNSGKFVDPVTGVTRKGVNFPAANDVLKARQHEAQLRSMQAAEDWAARWVGKMVDATADGAGDIIDRGALYYSPFFRAGVAIPGTEGTFFAQPGRWAMRAVYNKFPTVKIGVDRGWDAIDRWFNELPRAARQVGGYRQMVSQARAQAGQTGAKISHYIDETFGSIPKDEAEAIGQFMSVRGSATRSDAHKQAMLEKISREFRHIPDLVDAKLTRPFREAELYVGNHVAERSGYWPQRWKNPKEDWDRMKEAVMSDPTSKFQVLKTRFAPDETFMAERVFEDPQEAIRFAQELGIKLNPIYDFREAFKLRGIEHGNQMAQGRLVENAKKYFGFSDSQLSRQTFQRVHPEYAAKVEQAFRENYQGVAIPWRASADEALDELSGDLVGIPQHLRSLINDPADALGETRRLLRREAAWEAREVAEVGEEALEAGRQAGLFKKRAGTGGTFIHLPHPLIARGFVDFLDGASTSKLLRRADRSPIVKFRLERTPQAKLMNRRELNAQSDVILVEAGKSYSALEQAEMMFSKPRSTSSARRGTRARSK
jgi:hypothetical protein